MPIDNYVVKSLELHLFFGRIMKEHSFFLEAGFTPAGASFAREAQIYKDEFEKLLSNAVSLSDGMVRTSVLQSGELVTRFTLLAEQQTERLTGIGIDQEITERQLRMGGDCRQWGNPMEMRRRVQQLNRMALQLLNGLIALKEKILEKVLCGELFTVNYPLLLEHIIREAKLYRKYVETLEREGDLTESVMKETECFWNQIMMEHAMFIRGLLDPAEEDLFWAANGFAREFSGLLDSCNQAQLRTMRGDSLDATLRLRDFKAAGTQGITECKIRSIILPLLADHVLREANHYIRLLQY